MNKENWVIITGSYFYCEKDGRGKNVMDIADATIYKNKTEEEMQLIAKNLMNGIKGMWQIKTYENALIKYEKRTYTDTSKKFKWGEHITLQDAIHYYNDGKIVSYYYKEETGIYYPENNDFPKTLNTEFIEKSKWRLIEKV